MVASTLQNGMERNRDTSLNKYREVNIDYLSLNVLKITAISRVCVAHVILLLFSTQYTKKSNFSYFLFCFREKLKTDHFKNNVFPSHYMPPPQPPTPILVRRNKLPLVRELALA